jgi:hypothetical protein
LDTPVFLVVKRAETLGAALREAGHAHRPPEALLPPCPPETQFNEFTADVGKLEVPTILRDATLALGVARDGVGNVVLQALLQPESQFAAGELEIEVARGGGEAEAEAAIEEVGVGQRAWLVVAELSPARQERLLGGAPAGRLGEQRGDILGEGFKVAGEEPSGAPLEANIGIVEASCSQGMEQVAQEALPGCLVESERAAVVEHQLHLFFRHLRDREFALPGGIISEINDRRHSPSPSVRSPSRVRVAAQRLLRERRTRPPATGSSSPRPPCP